jgi:hypothetical protein
MRIAFLVGERALRQKLAEPLEAADVTIDHFPTVAKALGAFETKHYDLIVLHWKAYPGFGCGDSKLDNLAALIPTVEFNRNLLYWEVGLRVINLVRDEESPNRTTPLLVLFPDLGRAEFGGGDQLTRESVLADLADRPPAEALFGSSRDDFCEAVARLLSS